jgi:hypothetical protein
MGKAKVIEDLQRYPAKGGRNQANGQFFVLRVLLDEGSIDLHKVKVGKLHGDLSFERCMDCLVRRLRPALAEQADGRAGLSTPGSELLLAKPLFDVLPCFRFGFIVIGDEVGLNACALPANFGAW